MAKEIERKYKVLDCIELDKYPYVEIKQGYLSVDPKKTVRIRIKDNKAFLTIKGKSEGIERDEFEYAIPIEDAIQMLKMTPHKIYKRRYLVQHKNHLWEVDIFEDQNQGLRIAEVELSKANEEVELPNWVGEEVSEDIRYFNSQLCLNPYCNWTSNK
ncbi:MAG: CYTH domain-containing protein [Prolixibacteraceae bacterium]